MPHGLGAWAPWLWPFLSGPAERPEAGWATPHDIVLETEALRLRRFGAPEEGVVPTLIVAPYALHGAAIVDFAERHSLVRRLMSAGLRGFYVLERRSATPAMRLLSIDDALAGLNVVVDDLGGRAQLIGVCQGGWLSLAYAARFPAKVEKLVLAGAPVDTDVASSGIVAGTRATSSEALEALVATGGGLVQGDRVQALFMAGRLQSDEPAEILQDRRTHLAEAFARWNLVTVDLPGRYWLETAEWLFRENRLAQDRFEALGRTLRLRDVTCPLFVLAGQRDLICPPLQALAAAALVGTPPEHIRQAVAPCGHLSLFMGAKTLAHEWRRIATFLGARVARARAVSPPSGSAGSPSGRRSVRPARRRAPG